jgi:hypothetical protein
MSLFCIADLVVSVRMPVRVPAVSVVVEEEETDDVGGESEAADDEDELRVGDFLRLKEALYSFQEDG